MVTKVDPLTYEIIRHKLFGVVDEAIIALENVSGTPITAEGHDLMGAAKQAIMLWLSLFLRPLAMIIGLIAGIALSIPRFKSGD